MDASTSIDEKLSSVGTAELTVQEVKTVDYLWKCNDLQQNAIRFADTKAGAALALAATTAGAAFHSASTLHSLAIWAQVSGIVVLGVAAFSFIASVVTTFAVIHPRGISQGRRGRLLHFVDIAESEADEFRKAILESEAEKLIAELSRDIHEVAVICRRKYYWVKYAVIAAGICCGSSLVFLGIAGFESLLTG